MTFFLFGIGFRYDLNDLKAVQVMSADFSMPENFYKILAGLLTNDSVSRIHLRHCRHLTSSDNFSISNLSDGCFNRLSINFFEKISAQNVESISPNQFSEINLNKFVSLNPDSLIGIKTEQVLALSKPNRFIPHQCDFLLSSIDLLSNSTKITVKSHCVW